MEPRLLGCVAVIARSFARIHEANLKKHGLLALTLDDPAVYDLVEEGARLSILELDELAPGRAVACELRHADGTTLAFTCRHSLDAEQLGWFRAGSALNALRTDALAG
jgi:aconitate hydratase